MHTLGSCCWLLIKNNSEGQIRGQEKSECWQWSSSRRSRALPWLMQPHVDFLWSQFDHSLNQWFPRLIRKQFYACKWTMKTAWIFLKSRPNKQMRMNMLSLFLVAVLCLCQFGPLRAVKSDSKRSWMNFQIILQHDCLKVTTE